MKKIFLFVLAFVAVSVTTEAQALKWSTYGNETDTVGNNATKYAQYGTDYAHSGLSVTVTVTKISGTVAGKIYWQGCNTSTGKYYNVDSVTVTDLAEATYAHQRTTRFPFKFIRASYTGGSSQSAAVTGRFYYFKQ